MYKERINSHYGPPNILARATGVLCTPRRWSVSCASHYAFLHPLILTQAILERNLRATIFSTDRRRNHPRLCG